MSALSILRLARGATVTGSIRLQGTELLARSEEEMRRVRGADVAMIFQEPMSALNPLFTIGNQIAEALMLHEGIAAREARTRTIALMARTGIREPERRVDSYPHQLSGGQLQRAVIAMALACRPKLLIADEPTTALDMTVRARIVKLLLDLQEEEVERNWKAGKPGEGMAILLITHDLSLVRRFAQRVAVMERGKVVESRDKDEIFTRPQQPLHGTTAEQRSRAPARARRGALAGAARDARSAGRVPEEGGRLAWPVPVGLVRRARLRGYLAARGRDHRHRR